MSTIRFHLTTTLTPDIAGLTDSGLTELRAAFRSLR
jgi:hypothetical protein